MAAGRIPKPGSQFGPCIEHCKHHDCAAIRYEAKLRCSFCDKPIGYETSYYKGEKGQSKLVHALCLETEIDKQRG